MTTDCPICSKWINTPAQLSTHGMYDNHTFVELGAATPEGLWDECNSLDKYRGLYGSPKVCPVIVLNADGKELWRVGDTASKDGWVASLTADPVVMHLLEERKL